MANTKKMRITLVALLLSQMTTFGQTAIPLVYDKECANDNFRVSEMPAIDKLPEITTLPDPFAWADGSGRSTDFKDWERHRFEIARQLQHYEFHYPHLQMFAKPKYSNSDSSNKYRQQIILY